MTGWKCRICNQRMPNGESRCTCKPCECKQRPVQVEVTKEGDTRKRFLCKPCYYRVKERYPEVQGTFI